MAEMITGLFPVPIYTTRIPLSTSLEFVRSVPHSRVEADNGYASDDQHLLDAPELKYLKKQIMIHVNKFMADMRVPPEVEFYITCSWSMLHDKGDYSGEHYHQNSLISGIVYLNVDEQSGSVVFKRDWQTLFPNAVSPEFNAFNAYNCDTVGFTPKNGELYLFPSFLKHNVTASESDIDRRCIAFNVFAKGPIHSGEATYLEL